MSKGGDSFVIHGIDFNKSEVCKKVRVYLNEYTASYRYKLETIENCPKLVEGVEKCKKIIDYKKYYRIRLLKLSPGGYVSIHKEKDLNGNLVLNVMVSSLPGRKKHF